MPPSKGVVLVCVWRRVELVCLGMCMVYGVVVCLCVVVVSVVVVVCCVCRVSRVSGVCRGVLP